MQGMASGAFFMAFSRSASVGGGRGAARPQAGLVAVVFGKTPMHVANDHPLESLRPGFGGFGAAPAFGDAYRRMLAFGNRRN